MTRSIPDWEALRGGISGDVVLPASPGYEAARKPVLANFHDVRPQAVVLCETPEDVSEAILFAGRHRLRAAPRSGGHCFAGRSSTEGIVIDVSPMSSVSVSGGVATVGAGARLGGVYDALDGHGLAIPAGCGQDLVLQDEVAQRRRAGAYQPRPFLLPLIQPSAWRDCLEKRAR